MDPKDIKEIKAIIDLMKKHDLSVFEIEKEGFRLKLQRGAPGSQAVAAAPAAAGGPAKGAAAAVFATSTRPLVSRSSLFTIETCPPLAISNASNSRNCFHNVGAPLGLVG